MTTPEIVKYGDGYFRRTIYGLGPYIADYKEQVLLTCIVRGWCPRFVMHSFLFALSLLFFFPDVEHQGRI